MIESTHRRRDWKMRLRPADDLGLDGFPELETASNVPKRALQSVWIDQLGEKARHAGEEEADCRNSSFA